MPEESDPLQSLIADIIESESRGDLVDRAELLRQHAEHASSLREFFANHDSMKVGSYTEDVTIPPSSPSLAEDVTLPASKVASDEAETLGAQTSTTGNAARVGDKVRYFGDYELLEEIARGGMGVVYKARQINLNRIVALKMILAGQLAGDEDVKRFYTEAEAAANLDHPGIVPIFEVGQHHGQHYFSMGYIEGQSLSQKVAKGPLPPREAAELVKKICQAMAYAHERGVIHRDLKPANILLDRNGQPKVTDFGVAKQMNADSGLTGTGQILGTPSYMAPEQANGKIDEVGTLADVYALGAILYCLVTGRPPFQAANPMDTLLQVIEKEPVAPKVLNNQVPTDLETICLKSLEKDSRNRYSSSSSMAEELARFLNDEPILARPIGGPARALRWCKRKPILAGMGASIVILILLLAIGGPIAALQQAALNQTALAANRARARAQVESLLTASPQSVPVIIQHLQADYDELTPQLQSQWENTDSSEAQRMRLSLALLRKDSRHIEFLSQRLTTVNVEEFLLIRQLLEPYAEALTDGFWQISLDQTKQLSERFRAACSLALYDPENVRWNEIANEVVTQLVAENSLSVGRWVEGFKPVRNRLIGPLARVFENRSEERTVHRILATSILAEYAADDPQLLSSLILKSDTQQFLALYPVLEPHAKASVPLIEQQLNAVLHSDNPQEPSVLSAANGAVALVRFGREDLVWPLLKDTPDRRLRSYLIDRFASHGVSIERLSAGLSRVEDAAIRQAVFLSLSAYPNDAFTASERDRLVDLTTKAFRDDPDSGVHASCDILLRNLNATEAIDTKPAAVPSAAWFVNLQNQTFAVLTGDKFTMGSPEHEFGRRPDEGQHQRLIPRRFAISSKEVTVEEFHRFLAARTEIAHTYSKQLSPESSCPQTSVTWYEAAAYCNWLSEQDGILQDEWAFIANADGKYASGMSIPADYLNRAGYRLPTEAEWEFACRAGSSNIRHYGDTDVLLGKYAWFLSNALDRSWPVGTKLPNRFGLFDMHGNAWEWCANIPDPYPSSESPSDDKFEFAQTVVDGQPRVLRGGSYFYHSVYTRAALRNKEPVDARYYGIGVRPVRTIR